MPSMELRVWERAVAHTRARVGYRAFWYSRTRVEDRVTARVGARMWLRILESLGD